MQDLRRRFLDEGRTQLRRWSEDLDGWFELAPAASVAHQWVGAAGLLGFGRICSLAREAENLLRERTVDGGEFRDVLHSLEVEFRSPTLASGPTARTPEPASNPDVLALAKAIAKDPGVEPGAVKDEPGAAEPIPCDRRDRS
jgi:hypothetical protein